jgi:hypothetical protein
MGLQKARADAISSIAEIVRTPELGEGIAAARDQRDAQTSGFEWLVRLGSDRPSPPAITASPTSASDEHEWVSKRD